MHMNVEVPYMHSLHSLSYVYLHFHLIFSFEQLLFLVEHLSNVKKNKLVKMNTAFLILFDFLF